MNFSSAGSLDEDPGDSIRYEWDFGDGSPISDRAQPDPHLHAARPLHRRADRDRLQRRADVDEHDDHASATPRRRSRSRRRSTAACSRSATRSRTGSRSPTPEDASIDCNDVRSRSCSATTSTATARKRRRAARASCRPAPRTSSHGGNVFGVHQRRATPTRAAGRRPGADDDQPGPDPPEAPGGRARRHAVRHDHGHQHRRRRPACTAAASRPGDWIQLNGPFNLHQIDADHVPLRGRRGRRPRPSGRRWRRSRSARARQTGPIVTTAEPDVDGQRRRRLERARRSRSRLTGKNELFLVFRAVTGGATGSNVRSTSTGWSSTATASRSSEDPDGGAPSAAPCRRRCR